MKMGADATLLQAGLDVSAPSETDVRGHSAQMLESGRETGKGLPFCCQSDAGTHLVGIRIKRTIQMLGRDEV